MKKFLVGAVLCVAVCLVDVSSFAKEISLGGMLIYSNSNISIEINFVKMEGDYCVVDIFFKENGVKCYAKRKSFYANRGEFYIDLTSKYKLTLFYAGTNGGEVYALLNDKQI